MKLKRIRYSDLNSRQKENFNFQKISAVLADYGFITIRLSDDWKAADFVAQHIDGEFIKVQLKSRLAFHKKYQGKDLYIVFSEGEAAYLPWRHRFQTRHGRMTADWKFLSDKPPGLDLPQGKVCSRFAAGQHLPGVKCPSVGLDAGEVNIITQNRKNARNSESVSSPEKSYSTYPLSGAENSRG